MSLIELVALLENLSQLDKISFFKVLAPKISDAELQSAFHASEYPVWSLYDAMKAAQVLLQMSHNN